MQMVMEKGSEKELPNNGHYIESQKSSFVYWFDNGSQVSLFHYHRMSQILIAVADRKWYLTSTF